MQVARIFLRAAEERDLPFLYRVYASTREDLSAVTGWSAEQRHAFVAMQFRAQHEHYHRHYPQASFDVVEVDDEPAGRLYVARGGHEMRIIDIALLPEWRGRGIGSGLLRSLLDEADAARKPVIIHVEQTNPAVRLYLRLGFAPQAENGIYRLMSRSPPGAAAIM